MQTKEQINDIAFQTESFLYALLAQLIAEDNAERWTIGVEVLTSVVASFIKEISKTISEDAYESEDFLRNFFIIQMSAKLKETNGTDNRS